MKAIVFDFGNVIGFFDYRLTLNRLAGFTDMPADKMRALIFDSDLEDAFESGKISAPEFIRKVRDLWRLQCPDATVADAWRDIFQPNRDVCRLIPALKGRYRLLLGSNTNELHSAHFRRQFADTLQHFDGLVLSHEIGVRKPRPEFFEHCRQRAGCSVEACLFIDDLPANVAGARACGWKGIVYKNFPDLQEGLRALGVLDGHSQSLSAK